jgi:hypothetical protein
MRFKNQLIVAALFLVLGAVGVLMNSRQAAAQGPNDGLAVRIVNPVPVPITGSTTITGTVGAAQSGVWNVGITGQPLSVRNIDEPGRTPYQETLRVSGGKNCGSVVCGPEFVFSPVPAGKRLFITDVSVSFVVSAGANVFIGDLEQISLNHTSVFLPFTRQGPYVPGTEQWITNQHVNYFVDQTVSPVVFAHVDTAHLSNEDSFATIAGYYVPRP